MKYIPMSQKELDQYEIVQKAIRKEITTEKAGELLKLSERHIYRLKAGVKKHGAKALVHGNRGKSGNRSMPQQDRDAITKLLHKYYDDFGPTFAAEKLEEDHGIKRDPKTVRSIMIAEGLWKPEVKKKSKHRSWRQRKAAYGEMQQFDGSYEYWFEDRGPKCCLLASIDDAKGSVTHAKFVEDEGVVPVFTFWKEYMLLHGKPRLIYLDKFSTYNMNMEYAKENHDLKTQFERALSELRVEKITAHSPEAKGRVERLFKTLQDRLIKEMRLRGISNMEEANAFLEEYLPRFNAMFAVEADSKADLHKRLSAAEKKKLDAIFSRQYTRTVNNDYTISYNSTWYQLTEKQPATVFARDKVVMEERLDGSVYIRLRGRYLNYKIIPKRQKKKAEDPWVLAASVKEAGPAKKQWRPSSNHPWRQYEKTKSQIKN